MGEVLARQQFQLLVISRVVGHQGELPAVVDDGVPAGELDDGRVAAAVLEREMEVGVVAVGVDHEHVDAVHQGQRLGNGIRLIQQVLQPQPGLDTGLARLACPEVGGLQVETVAGEARVVEAVDGAHPVDGGDQAGVVARPAQRVGVLDDAGRVHAVAFAPGRERDDQRLGRLRPVHAASGENGKVVGVPENPGAHGVRLAGSDRRGQRSAGRLVGSAHPVEPVVGERRGHDLQPDRQVVVLRQARGHRHTAVPGQVQRQRAQIEQVHGQRIVDLLPEPEGRRGGGRRDQDVDALVGPVEIGGDQRAHFLRLVVVRVVVAGRQRVGADHDAALDFRAESGSAGQRHHLFGTVRAVVADPHAVPHGVEASQVARYLRRQDQVVGGQRVVEVRAVDLADLGAERSQLLDGAVERRQHARLVALATAQLLDHSDPDALEVAGRAGPRCCHNLGYRREQRGRVAWVMAGDHLVQQCGVEDRARARAALIQRRRAGHQAVARHRSVGRFDPDGRGQRSRLADGTAGVRADGQRGLERRERGRAAAAGTAGHPVGVPRVAGRAVGGVLRRGAHGELVHVGLAEDRDAGRPHPRGHRGVVRRHPALEDLRAAGGRHTHGGENVLERQRNSGQRRGQLLAGGHCRVHRGGGGERLLGRHMQEGVVALVGGGDLVQAGLGDLDRGQFLGRDLRAQRGGVEADRSRSRLLPQDLRHREAALVGGRRLGQRLGLGQAWRTRSGRVTLASCSGLPVGATSVTSTA